MVLVRVRSARFESLNSNEGLLRLMLPRAGTAAFIAALPHGRRRHAGTTVNFSSRWSCSTLTF